MTVTILEPTLAREQAAESREVRFAALVNRQSRFVFRVAYAVVRSVPDAEDIVQETFLKLYRSGAWESMDDERAFLARAAWRLSISHLRKRRSEPAEAPSVNWITPEAAVIEADRDAAVHRLIDALPEELRQPLALSTVDELSSAEIAKVMGIPEGTVRTRLMRARQILKQKLSVLMGSAYEQ